MQTRISSKGQVVLPGAIRRRLGLRTGDKLEASIRAGQIVLAPPSVRAIRTSIRRDPITGLPVLSAGPKAQMLTGEQVQEILANFP